MKSSEYASAIQPNTRWMNVIILTSILVPVLVAILIYLPDDTRMASLDVSFLPHLNAMLNSATATCLVISLAAILNGHVRAHKTANLAAFGLSSIFLICYVIYHYAARHTSFGDMDHDGVLSDMERTTAGSGRMVYLTLLLTHILLAIAVVPLVLFSMYYSLSGQFTRHKRLSRITWPVWFYVAVSGVIVYWLISPYYIS